MTREGEESGMRRGAGFVAAACAVLALAACDRASSVDDEAEDDGVVAESTTSIAAGADATPSHDSPAGAMAGLLAAMRGGTTDEVVEWVSPEPDSDRASITQTARMSGMLGLDGTLFWEVGDRHVVGVKENGDDAADVTLDGYLVWCTGTGADDPKASCAQPNGTGDTQTTTYPAVRVEGQWYVHLDLNHGELIQGNPGSGGVAG